MTIIYPCGCSKKKVAEGTPYEGWVHKYCSQHNPYANVASRTTND